MNLIHCMNHDYFWIAFTVLLDLAVAAGYVLIALHWRRNELLLRDTPAKSALSNMKRIFIFCGVCGYLFVPIKMFWPAWRLYDFFLCALVYFTWSYALRARELRVVYHQLNLSEELAADLQRAKNEIRGKTDFLNAISHDLKTPLNGLMLQAELASIHVAEGDSKSVLEAVEQIKVCARSTNELLNYLIEVGRLEVADGSMRLREFSVDELLRSSLDQFSARASEKGLTLKIEAPSNLTLLTDRLMLERIVNNLVDNAIKYTSQGRVEIAAFERQGETFIEVTDTGIGVPSEDRHRIFEDFVQIDNLERDSRKGYGLGLSISRRLAERIGASLTVESRREAGSRFVIGFPRPEPSVVQSN